MTSSSGKFDIPDSFSFGLEERPEDKKSIKVDVPDAPDCKHNWFRRDEKRQTLRHEGKTVVECSECRKSVAVYDWKIQNLGD
jgi:hypothetical protein